MRAMDENGLRLCRWQADLLEASIEMTQCSSAIFLRRYMNSEMVKRMDKGSILFESSTKQSLIDELDEEFGATTYGKEKYSANEMHWIGYIYRYWCYTYEISSKQVYKIIKPGELRKLYFPYHSLACDGAIERILEARGKSEEDMIARGVKILRALELREK